MKRLEGKVAVITGGSSGIGAAAARLFVEEGAKVAVFSRSDDELRMLASALGDSALPVAGDASKLPDLERLFQTAHRSFGKIDVVFANAGMNNPTDTIEAMTEDGYDKTFAVNTKGV